MPFKKFVQDIRVESLLLELIKNSSYPKAI